MKCKQCGNNIEKVWNFCPNCGRRLDPIKRFRFPSFGSRKSEHFETDDFGDIERQMEREIGKMVKIFGGEGMPNIKIKFGTMGGEHPMQKEINPVAREPQARKIPAKQIVRKVEKTEEPEAKIKKIGSSMEIVIELPGVKSLKDIILKRYEESLEIRAYAGKKMYFKLIPVPKQAKLNEKSFNKSSLVLVLNS